MRLTKTKNRLLGATSRWLDSVAQSIDHARRITKFLAGRAAFVVRPDDVFISSYPRSGTTLTQWMVYLLANGEQPEPEHLTQVSPWFERSLALGEHTAETLDRFASPRIFKSHLPRAWLPDGGRYIYVERDRADVLVSYYHLYCDYLGFEGSFDTFYRRFMTGRVQYGSWFDHVRAWQAHANDRDVMIVSYESLCEDRRSNAVRIADFLQLANVDETLEHAVAQSSFEAMKAREHVFDHATALLLEQGVRPKSFIRSGRVGGGEVRLSAEQQRSLRETESTGRLPAIRDLAAFLQ